MSVSVTAPLAPPAHALTPAGVRITEFAARPGVRDAMALRQQCGDAFLLHHARPVGSAVPQRTRDTHAEDTPTSELVFRLYVVQRQSAAAPPRTISLGRVDGNDIVVRDETISKQHAVFTELPGGALVLRDVRSRNGTFVNQKRLGSEACNVADGSVIRFGSVSMVLLDARGLSELIARLIR